MTCDNCNLKSSKLDIAVCFKLFKPTKQGEFSSPWLPLSLQGASGVEHDVMLTGPWMESNEEVRFLAANIPSKQVV